MSTEGAKSVANSMLDQSVAFFDKALQIDDLHTRSLVNKGAAIEVRTPGSGHAITLYEKALGFAHVCIGIKITITVGHGLTRQEVLCSNFNYQKKSAIDNPYECGGQIIWVALAEMAYSRLGTTWEIPI